MSFFTPLKKIFGRNLGGRDFLKSYIGSNAIGAEIGVWKGDFSELMLETDKFSKYYLIDPYKFMPQYPTRMYGGKKAKSQSDMDNIFDSVQLRLGKFDTEKIFLRDFSSTASDSIENASLDFLYIDGNHYYEGVFDDLKFYLKKMKVGSYVIMDDWNWMDDEGSLSVRVATCDFISKHPNCLQLVEIFNGQGVFLVSSNKCFEGNN